MRSQRVEIAGPENLTLNQVAQAVQAASRTNGSVGHVPLPAMRLMATLLAPIKPALAGEIMAGIFLDTVDRKIQPVATREQHPSIPLTRLGELVGQLNPTAASG